MNVSTPGTSSLRIHIDQDTGRRVFRALLREEPSSCDATYLREWPHAVRGSGTARRRCDALRPDVSDGGRLVAAVLGTLLDPLTFWPDMDLATVTLGRELRAMIRATTEEAGQSSATGIVSRTEQEGEGWSHQTH